MTNPFSNRAGELMGWRGKPPPPYVRGSADYECPDCGKLARAHAREAFGPVDEPLYLLKLCNGRYIKP